MNEGVRTRRAASCDLCGMAGRTLYEGLRDRMHGAPGEWGFLECSGCGLVWLDPRPIPEDIHLLYTEYYTHEGPRAAQISPARLGFKNALIGTAFGYGNVGTAGRLLGRILGGLRVTRDLAGGDVLWLGAAHKGDLLDVGCGSGRFLTRMQELGWKVMGVEPDPASAKLAAEHLGLETFCGTLEEADLPARVFHAITMNHVIEHVADPLETLRECHRVLRPGGRLVVVTPNIRSVGRRWFGEAWQHWDPPRHLFLFTCDTLRTIAGRAGLQVVELRSTARMARTTFRASHLLQRDGTIPGGPPPSLLRSLRPDGVLFWVLEDIACNAVDVGEELLMVATRE